MQHFEQDLQTLKDRLLTMASQAGKRVSHAIQALVERDDELARRVEREDVVLDRMELELDDMSIALLSKAPLAMDLRLIAAAMKITQNLERVGDETTTVARRVVDLNQEAQLKPYIDIPRMARMAMEMLEASLAAFVNRQPEKARQVVPRDKEVDLLNKRLHDELVDLMHKDSATITRCLNLIVISKCLERIADHAANIAEEVVFLYEATDIRHQSGLSAP